MIEDRWTDKDTNDSVTRYKGQGIISNTTLRVYTPRLINSDQDFVMHGGGDTPCKTEVGNLFEDRQKVCRVINLITQYC